ncbi:hypothetical protein LCGC14_0780970 [marine sediment metagenome]|jgi:hypothetical protein|uniref:Uncharacterized protein n=1 Tax=marine sediment metagenome TaxID=412755 RepID=A0A0F9QFD5_9ZZZZ
MADISHARERCGGTGKGPAGDLPMTPLAEATHLGPVLAR